MSKIKDFNEAGKIVLQELTDYLDSSYSENGKVLVQQLPEIISGELELEHLLLNGINKEGSLKSFLKAYLHNTQHMHHPHYMGHQVAVPHPLASMAEFIHGVVNNPMAIYEMGPAAATIEKFIINWMLRHIGWFRGESLYETDDARISGGGVLTHGGSLANMTGLLAARARACPSCWSEGLKEEMVLLAPAYAHYSIARSASILGLGASRVIPVKVNALEVVEPDALNKQIDGLLSNDKKIMAVVASACATATGLYDPLDEIGDICRENGLWYHIDGAHGASAYLANKEKHLMKGAEKADSMIWDAHKMLRTPALSAAVLFRDHEDLSRTFRQEGSYLIFDKEKIGFDFMHHTVECTKSALGPKIFWALAAEGEAAVGKYVQESYDRTKAFYRILSAASDFECPYVPQSNILCFRYSGGPASDAFQLGLRNQVVEKGDFYITSTEINGRRFLRLVIMHPDTGEEHIQKLMDQIRALGEDTILIKD